MRHNKQRKFFNPFYKTGRNTKLQQQIEDGEVKLTLESWETGLEKFKKMRAKYLIY
jgi:uncharacterized protein YbbC (DUF1343 family)